MSSSFEIKVPPKRHHGENKWLRFQLLAWLSFALLVTMATMGEASAFKSGREFAAYVSLVPKQTGTGGKIRLLGISKRGDTYLRTLFIHGARAAALLAKEPGQWITELKKRRPTSVAIVAMANKLARTVSE